MSDPVTLQPGLQPGAPFGVVGPEAVTRCKCGRGRHQTKPGLCAGGHTWRGEPGPAFVGEAGRSAVQRERLEPLVQAIALRALIDIGTTAEDATEPQKAVAAGLGQATVLRDDAFYRHVGSRKRSEKTFSRWLAAAQQALRHAERLGLERRARAVRTLEEALSAAPELAPVPREARNQTKENQDGHD